MVVGRAQFKTPNSGFGYKGQTERVKASIGLKEITIPKKIIQKRH